MGGDAQTVNAFNLPAERAELPAAILQPPYFDPARSDAMNHGAIGAIIGHGSATASTTWGSSTQRAVAQLVDAG